MKALTTSFYHNGSRIIFYLFFYRFKSESQEKSPVDHKVTYCRQKVNIS